MRHYFCGCLPAPPASYTLCVMCPKEGARWEATCMVQAAEGGDCGRLGDRQTGFLGWGPATHC